MAQKVSINNKKTWEAEDNHPNPIQRENNKPPKIVKFVIYIRN